MADLNLFVWAAGAAVYLLGALVLRHIDPRLSRAMAWLGAFTVVLTLDDRFLLPEVVLPYLPGLPEIVTYAAYGLVTAWLLAAYRDVLLRQPETVTLLLAVAALGVSVGLDVLGWDSTTRRVAEETAKMLGAVAWLCFPAAIIVRHLASGDTNSQPAKAQASQHIDRSQD